MSAKLKTAVLGATGYSGLELTRLLHRHPKLEQPVLLRRNGANGAGNVSDGNHADVYQADLNLADVFPALAVS